MSKYDRFLNALIVALVVMVGLHFYSLYGAGLPVNQVVTQKTDIFSVTGEGRVSATPNSADVSLGVSTEATTALAAQEQANQLMNRVVEQLKSLDIEDRDIKTTDYTIFPQYGLITSEDRGNRITGYQVNINLQVHVRDLDRLNTVIDTATLAGANQVGSIQLSINESERKQLLAEAREIAVAEARSKAEALADAAGITLGRVINVQEGERGSPPVPLAAELAVDVARLGAPTEIQPGTSEIVSQVTLYYEIR
jgi:uncharacterized protein YggE